jgi:glycosyltransferase involved in cell wall biosynthesis
MKILRIIARLNVGGPAKHVVWLTAGLQSSECETLLVAGTVPPGEDDMGYFAEELGVRPLFVPEMTREISFKDALTIWKLYRLFLRERPDIVHTHTAKAGTVGRLAGFLYRWFTPGTLVGRPRVCKFVHTYHGHIFHSYYGPLKTRLFVIIERVLARLVTDRIVVISEQQRREIHDEFHVGRDGQFAVIPLGLDTRVFAGWQERRRIFRDELGAGDNDILVGIIGRLTEIKNHELFLRAAALYVGVHLGVRPDSNTDQPAKRVRFVIIGDGHLRENLEQQSQVLGLSELLVFTGMRKDPEVFYPALDIVALTSRNEGTPLTLIEAMLNARPVIATAVGGVVDLLGDAVSTVAESGGFKICERGISVQPGDASGFANGLARLINNEELRSTIGEMGRQFIEQQYAKERLLADIDALYQELLKPATVAVNVRQTSVCR